MIPDPITFDDTYRGREGTRRKGGVATITDTGKRASEEVDEK